ncbi:MAPK regulated corepressor interacting protein 2-like [Liolophura sinensis]|uniref:MAPK regulated corepressor interacting protein 2-like n=1 Tax=Liolophura sinensis TaxID=3198878 RepID=UPI0031581A15
MNLPEGACFICACKHSKLGMYSLNRGPSRFVTSTRRGGTKKIDSFEGRDLGKRTGSSGPATSMSSPMPVFIGKRPNSGRLPPLNSTVSEEPASPQHEEYVHFMSTLWSEIQHEQSRASGPVKYCEEAGNPELTNFKPFDLEEWWGTRTLQKIKESS